jgi:hypothetical protein
LGQASAISLAGLDRHFFDLQHNLRGHRWLGNSPHSAAAGIVALSVVMRPEGESNQPAIRGAQRAAERKKQE